MNFSKQVAWRISIPFLLGIALSYPLWFGVGRSFPQLGLGFLEPFLPVFSSGLVLSLLIFLWKNETAWSKGLCLFFLTLCVLSDIHTLQVWVYFYALLFGLLLFSKDERLLYEALLLFLAGFYFWSGFHKLNVWYASSEFPWFLGAFKSLKVIAHQRWLSYGSATLEMSAGIALLFPKSRQLALGFLVLMHLVICVLLSPLGHGWNYVVLPWNAALIGLLGLLFFYKNTDTFKPFSFFEKQTFQPKSMRFVALFAWFLPFLSLLGMFERPLSFHHYTGMQPEVTLFWDAKSKTTIPERVIKNQSYRMKANQRLQIADWSMNELGVPPYNSPWAVKKTCEKVCERYLENSETSGYFLLHVKRFDRRSLNTETYSCGE